MFQLLDSILHLYVSFKLLDYSHRRKYTETNGKKFYSPHCPRLIWFLFKPDTLYVMRFPMWRDIPWHLPPGERCILCQKLDALSISGILRFDERSIHPQVDSPA